MKENPTYYIRIPADVRYDENISLGSKMLYGEIQLLSRKAGYCWASNEFFAKLYKVHKNTIQNWITALKNYGYVRMETKQSQSGSERKIFLIPQSQKLVIGQ